MVPESRINVISCHLVVLIWLTITSRVTAFQGFFQGHCGVNSPCEQRCVDGFDGTFHCACIGQYRIGTDGYTCYKISDISSEQEESYVQGDSSESFTFSSTHSELSGKIHSDNTFEKTKRKKAEWDSVGDRTTKYGSSDYFAYVHRGRVQSSEYDDSVEQSGDGYERPTDTAHMTFEDDEDFVNEDVYGSSINSTSPVAANAKASLLNKDIDSLDEETTRVNRCEDIICLAGGICVADSNYSHQIRCQCPLGRSGKYCQREVSIRWPRFSGHSYMSVHLAADMDTHFQIELVINASDPDGLVLYSSQFDPRHAPDKGDFVTLVLHRGYLVYSFNCGGESVEIRSSSPIELHRNTTVVIGKDYQLGWLRVNNRSDIYGSAEGEHFELTLGLPLYIGGYSDMYALTSGTIAHNVNKGFSGSLLASSINGRTIDLKIQPQGDILDGRDVGDVAESLCAKLRCYNGGSCVALQTSSASCYCPLGYGGPDCQTAVHIHIPEFKGVSHLALPSIASMFHVLSYLELEVVFKPHHPTGILLYNGYQSDGAGDFILLQLEDGFVVFSFDLGSGPAILRSLEPLEMDEWHVVWISRTGRQGLMRVDQQIPVQNLAPGAYLQLSLTQPLYMGGLSVDGVNIHKQSSTTFAPTGFFGCIQQVVIQHKPLDISALSQSGVNVGNCPHACAGEPCKHGGRCVPLQDYYTCDCRLGYQRSNCEQKSVLPLSTVKFNGRSYLRYNRPPIMRRINGNRNHVQIVFKTNHSHGLLLWSSQSQMGPSADFIAIGIRDSHVEFRYNLGSGEIVLTDNSINVTDGRWHTVTIIRSNKEGTLRVDDTYIVADVSPGTLQQLNIDKFMYLGGMLEVSRNTLAKYSDNFDGCISKVVLSTDYDLELTEHAELGWNILPCM